MPVPPPAAPSRPLPAADQDGEREVAAQRAARIAAWEQAVRRAWATGPEGKAAVRAAQGALDAEAEAWDTRVRASRVAASARADADASRGAADLAEAQRATLLVSDAEAALSTAHRAWAAAASAASAVVPQVL